MENILDLIFTAFRLASAGVVTGAAAYIGWGLHRRTLAPRPVWWYSLIVLVFVALFRWVVVVLLMDDYVGYANIIEPWFQPLTQTSTILLGLVIFVLSYTHVKARGRHMDNYHGGKDAD